MEQVAMAATATSGAASSETISVAEAVGRTVAGLGTTVAFGLAGSGNLIVSNALVDAGVSYYSGNHESAVVGMADGYSRVTGELGVATVHQGPGLTNAVTSLVEAAKSRTPLLVLAGDTDSRTVGGNLDIDQDSVVRAAGAIAERIRSPQTAVDDVVRAVRRARLERRPVVLSMPIDIQAAEVRFDGTVPTFAVPHPPGPAEDALDAILQRIERSDRPVILAGRGAALSGARRELEALADRIGALLVTSAVAKDLFVGNPYSIGFAGGFSLPLTAEVLPQADLLLAFGAGLNEWTLARGRMLGPQVSIVQCDTEPGAFGTHRAVDLGVVGDARTVASALVERLDRTRATRRGFRTPELAARIADYRAADGVVDQSTAEQIDPRTLMVELDRLLPSSRAVVTDAGHFQGFPPRYVSVDDEFGFIMPIAFQSVGLGLGEAFGAAVGRGERLTVAVLGDGGTMMSLPELDTVVRHGTPLLIVVVNDAAYGAETHQFEPRGIPAELARFPDRDFAAIARAVGAQALTIRSVDDLAALRAWLDDPSGPMVLDCKVNPDVRADYVAEAVAHEHEGVPA